MAPVAMTSDQLARMKQIRLEIETLLRPYRENTEAALAAAACLQVARTLFLLYPPKVRDQLTTGAAAFIKGENLDRAPIDGFIIPKGVM